MGAKIIVNRNQMLDGLQEKYFGRFNILYAVLEIGKNHNRPPEWAIEECRKYYQYASKAKEDLAKKKIYTNHPKDLDIECLEKMAEILVHNTRMNRRKAAVIALGDPDADTNIRRLCRYWDREYPNKSKVLEKHPRFIRASARINKNNS